MNRELQEKPMGCCSLCLLDPVQLFTMVTANMVTVWLKKHNIQSRDSIAKQNSGQHKYRNVHVCRFCAQQFNLSSTKRKGTVGPNHSNMSIKRQQQMALESSRTRVVFNATLAKANYALSVERQLRYRKEKIRQEQMIQEQKDNEEKQKEQKRTNELRMMSRHNGTKTFKTCKFEAAVEATALVAKPTTESLLAHSSSPTPSHSSSNKSLPSSTSSVSSVASISISDDENNQHLQDQFMDRQIKRLKLKQRSIIAENALMTIAENRLHAENIRDPGTQTLNASQQIPVTGTNQTQPTFIYKGKWWGLARMPHRHVSAMLKFKGRGKKIAVGKSGGPRRPPVTAPKKKGNGGRPMWSTGRLIRTKVNPESLLQRPKSARVHRNKQSTPSIHTSTMSFSTSSFDSTTCSTSRTTPTPRSTSIKGRIMKRTRSTRIRPASARSYRKTTKLHVRVNQKQQPERPMESTKREPRRPPFATPSTLHVPTSPATSSPRPSPRPSPRVSPTQRQHTPPFSSSAPRSSPYHQHHQDWKNQKMKRKALAARSKANDQVQKQHRQNTRYDAENKRKPHRTVSKLQLHQFFSQASCSVDSAAVLMGHLRKLPKNNQMYIGICHVIAKEHANGSIGTSSGGGGGNSSVVNEYILHDFSQHSVAFLKRNYLNKVTRRQCYLALSICAMRDTTENLIGSGLIEILTVVLDVVVRDCFELHQQHLQQQQHKEQRTHQAQNNSNNNKKKKKKKKTKKELDNYHQQLQEQTQQQLVQKMNVCNELGDICRLLDLLVDPGGGNDANNKCTRTTMASAATTLSDVPLIRKLQLIIWESNLLNASTVMYKWLTPQSRSSMQRLAFGLSKY
jgi:lipocalin